MFKPLLLALLLPFSVLAQNVGINTTTPNGRLHVNSEGFVTPLVLEIPAAEQQATPFIKFIREGVEVFRLGATYTNFFAGVDAGKNCFGADNNLIGRSSGMNITNGNGNTAMGDRTLVATTSGSYNTAFGALALNNANSSFNTAIGSQAMFTQSGGYNTAVGARAMYLNSASNQFNVAVGFEAMRGSTVNANNVGTNNVAIGNSALLNNSSGFDNTATGNEALQGNTTGAHLVAVGMAALKYNTTGVFNTAVGKQSLQFNNAGSYNTAVGYLTLGNTNGAQYNTAIGYRSGDGFNNGYNNVFVGANADVSAAGLFNVIALGQGTTVAASSVARFGNSATTSYGGWAGWTNISDGRFKTEVKENVPGLTFINKLRPVTYHLQASALDAFQKEGVTKSMSKKAADAYAAALREKENIVQTGFIAQEVQLAAASLGYEFSGVDKPKNDKDVYGLRYAEFVVPLVKAVQELSVQTDLQDKLITELMQQQQLLIELVKKRKVGK